jgi:hypothetical protein
MSCAGVYFRCVSCSFYNQSAGEYNLWYKLRKLKRASCSGYVECKRQEAFLQSVLSEINILTTSELIPGQVYKLKIIEGNGLWDTIKEIRLQPILDEEELEMQLCE